MTQQQVPTHIALLWPTLKALERLGGSASIQELSEQVASELDLSKDILDIPHNNGRQSKVENRATWARSWLKKYLHAIDNTSRGVWTITEIGRKIPTEQSLLEQINQEVAKHRNEKKPQAVEPQTEDDDELEEQDWKEDLLSVIHGITPGAFERLCQRVLRESGFTKVEVTGRSGDGGIDGVGVLLVNLISFRVCFQCKRYAESLVGAPAIRDFRGAMVGKADKGLFITTGGFTKGAEQEAVRDGAPAIDLIDGTNLCELLKKLELGVSVEFVEVVSPKPEFFENL